MVFNRLVAACAVVGDSKGFFAIVACSALGARFDFFHSDGFAALAHDREDALLVAYAAALPVRLPIKGYGTVLLVKPGE